MSASDLIVLAAVGGFLFGLGTTGLFLISHYEKKLKYEGEALRAVKRVVRIKTNQRETRDNEYINNRRRRVNT